MMGIIMIFIPYCYELWHFYLCICIIGLGSGAWVNVHRVWLLEIFPQNGATLLQIAGLMEGIGHILCPLIFKSYLTGENNNQTNETAILILNDERRFKLKIPFLIIGIIGLTGIMFVFKNYCNYCNICVFT